MQIDLVIISNFLIVAAVVALIFLIYTLANLESLEIPVTHPRVLVELTLFVVLLVIGLYLQFG